MRFFACVFLHAFLPWVGPSNEIESFISIYKRHNKRILLCIHFAAACLLHDGQCHKKHRSLLLLLLLFRFHCILSTFFTIYDVRDGIVAGWLVCFKRISKLFDPISMIIIQIGATFYKQTHTHQKPSPCAYFSVESAFVVLICWFTFSVHFSHNNNSTTVANNSF